jgi:predicted SAM-dependent methyltransferase
MNNLKMEKLEIGSGNKPKEGYLHFDVRENVKADIVGDARKLPFNDEEFSEVYSRFFLEHLLRKDALVALSEMFRVLKKGGTLEIIVPNIDYFFKLFTTETGQKKEWALNKIYGFENYIQDHHYFGYDEDTLTKALILSGFCEIERVNEEEQYLHLRAKKI